MGSDTERAEKDDQEMSDLLNNAMNEAKKIKMNFGGKTKKNRKIYSNREMSNSQDYGSYYGGVSYGPRTGPDWDENNHNRHSDAWRADPANAAALKKDEYMADRRQGMRGGAYKPHTGAEWDPKDHRRKLAYEGGANYGPRTGPDWDENNHNKHSSQWKSDPSNAAALRKDQYMNDRRMRGGAYDDMDDDYYGYDDDMQGGRQGNFTNHSHESHTGAEWDPNDRRRKLEYENYGGARPIHPFSGPHNTDKYDPSDLRRHSQEYRDANPDIARLDDMKRARYARENQMGGARPNHPFSGPHNRNDYDDSDMRKHSQQFRDSHPDIAHRDDVKNAWRKNHGMTGGDAMAAVAPYVNTLSSFLQQNGINVDKTQVARLISNTANQLRTPNSDLYQNVQAAVDQIKSNPQKALDMVQDRLNQGQQWLNQARSGQW